MKFIHLTDTHVIGKPGMPVHLMVGKSDDTCACAEPSQQFLL